MAALIPHPLPDAARRQRGRVLLPQRAVPCGSHHRRVLQAAVLPQLLHSAPQLLVAGAHGGVHAPHPRAALPDHRIDAQLQARGQEGQVGSHETGKVDTAG